ncbi:MAG: hypothetical protein ACYCSN_04405 [Acidobacteriaceae bacterium]
MQQSSPISLAEIRDAGYQGIQFVSPPDKESLKEARELGLGVCGSGRVNLPGEADALALQARDCGLECLTLHVGWGLENDDQGARLIEDVLNASTKHDVPLYPESLFTIFSGCIRLRHQVRYMQQVLRGDSSGAWSAESTIRAM